MRLPSTTDVLIVGAGPVGMTLGNLLGRYGVSALIIDKAPGILTHPRAIALDNEALRILQMAGLAEGAFETVAIPAVHLHSPFMGEFARADTAGCIDGHPKLVNFYQPDLEAALEQALQQYPAVRQCREVELLGFSQSDAGIAAEVGLADSTRQVLHAKYLVGADGASSIVRQQLGLGFQGKSFTEDWLIVDARHVPRPIDHIEFICDHRRPTPHMVAPGQRERWEFMLQPGESREEMLHLDKIFELLAPWMRPDEAQIERTAVYRFHARIVERFQKGRAFLVGDAAHITPPFVGQGLCAGLRDVGNLAWKLAWVLNGRAGSGILDSYDQERRPHAESMIRLAQLMGKLVMPRSAIGTFLVHGLVRLLRTIPALRAQFDELKIKPMNQFKHGLFIAARHGARLIRGAHFTQGLLRQPGGRYLLSDEVLGLHVTLVGFGVDPHGLLDRATLDAWSAAGGHIVQICHRGQRLHRADAPHVWEDVSGDFLPGQAPFGWLAIVRPDRTLITDGPMANASRLVQETLGLLRPIGESSGVVAAL